MGLANKAGKNQSDKKEKSNFLDRASKFREKINDANIPIAQSSTDDIKRSSNFLKRANWLRQSNSETQSDDFINIPNNLSSRKNTDEYSDAPIDYSPSPTPGIPASQNIKAVFESNSLDDIIDKIGGVLESFADKLNINVKSEGPVDSVITPKVELSGLDKPIQAELKTDLQIPISLSHDTAEIIPVNSPFSEHRDSLSGAQQRVQSGEYKSAIDQLQETADVIPNRTIRTKILQNIQDIETHVSSNNLPMSTGSEIAPDSMQGAEGALSQNTIDSLTEQISKSILDIQQSVMNKSVASSPQETEATPVEDDMQGADKPAPSMPSMPPLMPSSSSSPEPGPESPMSSTVQQISGVLELKQPEEEDSPFLTLTFDFDRIPHHFSLSKDHEILEYAYYKYKPMLVKAQKYVKRKQITKAMNYYRVIREQQIPREFKRMIDKNINDLTDYLEKYLSTR